MASADKEPKTKDIGKASQYKGVLKNNAGDICMSEIRPS